MPSFDRLQAAHRDLARLVAERDYRAAREWLEAHDHADAVVTLDVHAASAWLWEAEEACRKGDRERMNACLTEAARFRRPENAARFREARRQIRQVTLELTSPFDWAEVLRVASYHRQQMLAGEPAPPRYATFAHPRLIEQVGLAGVDLDALEARDLTTALDAVAAAYPEELAHRVRRLGVPFARCALWIAGGRPDLAVLDLLELPDADPLVCLERARVAYALGLSVPAALALTDFLMHHGRHVVVRRLHTGVFLAQLAHANGDDARAVDILQSLPRDGIGRRPVLLLAELLEGLGRQDEAAKVLRAWSDDHPSDDDAAERLKHLTL
ncbi:MAG: hypothetical protein KC656_21315 [Myxococcales bacterium]|nr:hypothetical protein [Myxococcales bacterium]